MISPTAFLAADEISAPRLPLPREVNARVSSVGMRHWHGEVTFSPFLIDILGGQNGAAAT